MRFKIEDTGSFISINNNNTIVLPFWIKLDHEKKVKLELAIQGLSNYKITDETGAIIANNKMDLISNDKARDIFNIEFSIDPITKDQIDFSFILIFRFLKDSEFEGMTNRYRVKMAVTRKSADNNKLQVNNIQIKKLEWSIYFWLTVSLVLLCLIVQLAWGVLNDKTIFDPMPKRFLNLFGISFFSTLLNLAVAFFGFDKIKWKELFGSIDSASSVFNNPEILIDRKSFLLFNKRTTTAFAAIFTLTIICIYYTFLPKQINLPNLLSLYYEKSDTTIEIKTDKIYSIDMKNTFVGINSKYLNGKKTINLGTYEQYSSKIYKILNKCDEEEKQLSMHDIILGTDDISKKARNSLSGIKDNSITIDKDCSVDFSFFQRYTLYIDSITKEFSRAKIFDISNAVIISERDSIIKLLPLYFAGKNNEFSSDATIKLEESDIRKCYTKLTSSTNEKGIKTLYEGGPTPAKKKYITFLIILYRMDSSTSLSAAFNSQIVSDFYGIFSNKTAKGEWSTLDFGIVNLFTLIETEFIARRKLLDEEMAPFLAIDSLVMNENLSRNHRKQLSQSLLSLAIIFKLNHKLLDPVFQTADTLDLFNGYQLPLEVEDNSTKDSKKYYMELLDLKN